MESGNMDRMIRLKRPEFNRDADTGQNVQELVDLEPPEEWAQIVDESGNELFQSDKKTARSSKKFKIHYREDVDEMCVVEYRGRLFDIDRMQEIQRRRGLLLYGTWTQGKYNE